MDDLVEGGFHAARAVGRLVLHALFDMLLDHLISPLGRLIAAVYRPVHHVLHAIFRFELVVRPLAALLVMAIFAGPLFIIGKAIESFLTWW